MSTKTSQRVSSTLRKPLVSALMLALGVTGSGAAAIAATAPQAHGSFQKQLHHLQELRTQKLAQLSQNPNWLRHQQRAQRIRPHHAKPTGATAVLAVNTCVDDSASLVTAGTLRNAVANAGDGDTIDLSTLACSTISLTQGALLVGVDNLTVTGPSASSLIVDGGGADRVFAHTGYGTLALDHLTVRNGAAVYSSQSNTLTSSVSSLTSAYGGCIYSAGTVNLNNTVVTGCVASTNSSQFSQGGGVYAQELDMVSSTISASVATVVRNSAYAFGGGAYVQTLSMQSSTISGNSATINGVYYGTGLGGGAVARDANLDNSVISGNTVAATYAKGGGIVAKYDSLVVQNSTISGNTAHGVSGSDADNYRATGGAVALKYNATVSIKASTISGNTAIADGEGLSYGGGVAASQPSRETRAGNGSTKPSAGANAYIGYSTINNNQAQNAGGAAFLSGLQMVQSTVTGNRADNGGGGIAFADDTTPTTIFNSTVANNSADYGGGILVLSSPSLTMLSNLAAKNTAQNGADMATAYFYYAGTGSYASVTVSGSNNVVMAASSYVTLPGDTLNVDPLLQPLADNGGPTLTQMLGEGSPVLTAGSNPNNYPYDQRGPGFPRSNAGVTNIGAVQVIAAPAAASTPVPALSTWGLSLLGGLLGWLGLRRRKHSLKPASSQFGRK